LRSRLIYLTAIAITMVCGLGSRAYAGKLPQAVAEHAGDMLWAGMVYFGFRLLLVNGKPGRAAVWSLLFSFAIEFSQLYQADWMQPVRASLIGSLVLGRGFLWIDLLRYAAGIAIAWLVDSRWLQSK